jgi:ubiquinone/menaquinone biosynthesis C-methylase UbiE
MSNNRLLEINRDQFRERLNKYTRKAFKMLPKLEKPRILDIGCGSGVPTIELAKLSEGEIIGIDVNQPFLDKLNIKIEEESI